MVGSSACAGPKQAVTSAPTETGMVADADLADWNGDLTPVEGQNVSLAIRNDEEALYLVLQSEDRGVIGQILALGLTVWFDPEGGTDRGFGVQYPVGLLNSDAATSINPETARQDPAQMEALLDRMRDEVILFADDADEARWAVQDVLAVDAEFHYETEVFTYELKVPLQKTWTEYAIGAPPGAVIGVGIETPEIDRAAMRARFGGGRPGSPPPGGRPDAQERVQVWIQVPLDAGS